MWNNNDVSAALNLGVLSVFEASGVAIDSRSIKKGEIFVALKGDNFDGHDYVNKAVENGAAAVIVEREIVKISAVQIIVDDTYEALVKLAKFRRKNSDAKFIAITGSVGKTSFKEALKIVLESYGKTYATIGNLNNHIGLPLCLANLPNDIRYAVFELGMNHAGEIKYLSNILEPELAFITKISDAHIGHFSGTEDIIKAKAEICSGLNDDASIILNNSDENYAELYAHIKREYKLEGSSIKSFGYNEGEVVIKNSELLINGVLMSFSHGGKSFKIQFAVHNPSLAELLVGVFAILAELSLDFDPGIEALSGFKQVKGRGNFVEYDLANKEFVLIDDSYNANFDSMRASIETLGLLDIGECKRRLVIIGDMLELGDKSSEYHMKLKNVLVQNKIDKVIAIGKFMEELYNSLPEGLRMEHFAELPQDLNLIFEKIEDGDVVLVKSSKGTGTYKIIEKLEELRGA